MRTKKFRIAPPLIRLPLLSFSGWGLSKDLSKCKEWSKLLHEHQAGLPKIANANDRLNAVKIGINRFKRFTDDFDLTLQNVECFFIKVIRHLSAFIGSIELHKSSRAVGIVYKFEKNTK